MNKYHCLFKESNLRGKHVKNRIVMSPMETNLMNPDGSISDAGLVYYLERAKGGAGIIIPGGVVVDFPVGNPTVVEISADYIEYTQNEESKRFDCDYVVAALGQKPYGLDLIEEIKSAGYETIGVGDASGSAKIGGAVLGGYNAAHSMN